MRIIMELDLENISLADLHELSIKIPEAINEREELLVDLNAEEMDFIKANKFIDAIKAYRLRVGCALRDAKYKIDKVKTILGNGFVPADPRMADFYNKKG